MNPYAEFHPNTVDSILSRHDNEIRTLQGENEERKLDVRDAVREIRDLKQWIIATLAGLVVMLIGSMTKFAFDFFTKH